MQVTFLSPWQLTLAPYQCTLAQTNLCWCALLSKSCWRKQFQCLKVATYLQPLSYHYTAHVFMHRYSTRCYLGYRHSCPSMDWNYPQFVKHGIQIHSDLYAKVAFPRPNKSYLAQRAIYWLYFLSILCTRHCKGYSVNYKQNKFLVVMPTELFGIMSIKRLIIIV